MEDRPIKIELGKLPHRERFIYHGGECLVLFGTQAELALFGVPAICYKADDTIYRVGEIYRFPPELEVVWFPVISENERRVRKSLADNCCPLCSAKLTSDNVSEVFGRYCPNE